MFEFKKLTSEIFFAGNSAYKNAFSSSIIDGEITEKVTSSFAFAAPSHTFATVVTPTKFKVKPSVDTDSTLLNVGVLKPAL